jgi:hypothetical protein
MRRSSTPLRGAPVSHRLSRDEFEGRLCQLRSSPLEGMGSGVTMSTDAETRRV